MSIRQPTEPPEDPPASTLGTVVPAESFVDVLKDLGEDDSTVEAHRRLRPSLPDFGEEKPSLAFQCIDTREGVGRDGRSQIHLFGVTKAGHSILVRIRNFEHYFYYPAPSGFKEEDLVPLCDHLNSLSSSRIPPVSSVELEDQRTTPGGTPIPFLKIYLSDHRNLRTIKDISGDVQYRELFSSPELTYETETPYFLRYMIDNEITALTWLKIPSKKYDFIPTESIISHCQLEVSVDEADLLICDTVDDREKFAPLRTLCFDIECNIPKTEGRFSDAKFDSVIQIGTMVSYYGQTVPSIRSVFTLGTCSPISGTEVLSFSDEKEMLHAWQKFVIEVDPDIVIGYNITQFDIPYLLQRAWTLKLPEFPFQGRIKASPQRFNPSQGRSNFFSCPGFDGRLILDVYHHIREHHIGLQGKGAYKLNGVSSHFLGQKKEDIDYKQIPELQNGDADTRRALAVYCMKDVYLALRLFEKLKCFEIETKEAKDAHVPFNTLRVWRSLKDISRQYLDAIEHEYVLADRV